MKRLGLVLLLACSSASTSVPSAMMPAYEGRPSRGFYRLLFDEYHSLSRATLERSAVAWKVLVTAVLMHERQSDPRLPLTEAAYAEVARRRWGFVVPRRIANWPATDPQPAFTRPMGIVYGTVSGRLPRVEMEVANTGCATCHAGVLYDAQGNPTRDVWLGLPSSSIDLGRYADEVFTALSAASARPDELLATIPRVFPAVSPVEVATLKKYYLPRLRERVRELGATIGGFTPYSNGGPGLTNGVATIKFYFGVIGTQKRDPTQVAFTSIPDAAGLRLRTSVLWDGVYAPPGWSHTGPLPAGTSPAQQRDAIGGVSAIVTVGTLGVTPAVAAGNVPRVREAVGWMEEEYQPPPFPGPVDLALAARGAAVFQEACTKCHGTYQDSPRGPRLASFPNHLSSTDVIGTDPVRAEAVKSGAGDLFAKTPMGAHMDARPTGGYIAPALTSLWATGPYLHNGSVPTLWHLMHPEARPARFQVGGHRLDFEKVGIDGHAAGDGVYRYPDGYQPWMLPEIYDARSPGRGNQGHDDQFAGMSEDDKRALLEFLKRV